MFLKFKNCKFVIKIVKIMLRVIVKDGNIEKALKKLKTKVYNTKQQQILNDLKDFTKPSVERRNEKLKAIYLESKKIENND